jgi:prepilin-type N-terminal cleavage/methylation domain-containing protein
MTFSRSATKIRSSRAAAARRQRGDKGMSLIELMFAMLILAIGLGGLTTLFIFASETNNKNSKATSSTMLAQQVLEQISAQHPDSIQVITLTDCAGNQWNVKTVGAAAPGGAGALIVTAASDPFYGGLDPAQAYAAIPAGYAMQYTDCAANGRRTVYDVRWNIVTLDPFTRLITVSARQVGPANQIGGRLFFLPATLRGIGGM